MKLKTIEAASTRSKSASAAAHGKGTSANPPAPTAAASTTLERACPTKLDGVMPLFQTRVTVSKCQSKQRGMYHKCFSCAHSNARR
ncbi:MAG: hypothetical protein ACI80K_004612 [Paracoccaceae bacterium]|jgi:hypothetical protein